MAIYLGDSGHVELKRRALNNVLSTDINVDDVDVISDRFSFAGVESESLLLSGDRVKFETVVPDSGPQPNLILLDGVTDQTGITRYVHVDPLGGIRLYDTFAGAIGGDRASALQLVQHSEDQPITVELEDTDYRCLGQLNSYEITTSRELIDLTTLGDEFRRNYASGLITGQGSFTAYWDYQHSEASREVEYAQYLVQLVLRLQLGCSFDGAFYIKGEGCEPLADTCPGLNATAFEAIWWEAQCIVTNVAMQFNPSALVETKIDFVTTEQFQLKSGSTPSFLLQEDDADLLSDPAPGAKIGLDQDN